MKILIINGSHKEGNSDLAIKEIKQKLDTQKNQVRELILRDIEMKLPDGCEQCAEGEICPNIKDEFSEKIEPTIRNYDTYILVTPTWSDSMTPLTKIFWDRIVSWCGEERMYLRNKKLALVVHGMAGKNSWKNVISWIESVCKWEECKFVGSLSFKSGGKKGDIKLSEENIDTFVKKIL